MERKLRMCTKIDPDKVFDMSPPPKLDDTL